MENKIRVSAPGTFMVAGEHAVLYGGSALVGAVDQRLYINLTPRLDKKLVIESDFFGYYEEDLTKLLAEGPYRFILLCFKHYIPFLQQGCSLTVHSDFLPSIGFGSSAAVTVATLKALHAWLSLNKTKRELHYEALGIIKAIQGVGSGADIAASIYGGIVYYQPKDFVIEPLKYFCDFSLIYVGYKLSTAEVINKVQSQMKENPGLYDRLFQDINCLTNEARRALINQSWPLFAEYLTKQNAIFSTMSLTNKDIEVIIQQCNQYKAVWGAKISGSGLGDCILCLGRLPSNSFPQTKEQKRQGVKQFNVKLSTYGVLTHTQRALERVYG